MNLTARQLLRNFKRGMNKRDKARTEQAAYEWSDRIERGPFRSCVPKKKQREAFLLPPITP